MCTVWPLACLYTNSLRPEFAAGLGKSRVVRNSVEEQGRCLSRLIRDQTYHRGAFPTLRDGMWYCNPHSNGRPAPRMWKWFWILTGAGLLTHSCPAHLPALARSVYGKWSWMEWQVSTRWSMAVGRRTVSHAVLHVVGYNSAWRSIWVNPWYPCSIKDCRHYIRLCVRERTPHIRFILRWLMFITSRLNICSNNTCYSPILPLYTISLCTWYTGTCSVW
jgi:hypothetical protein